MLIRAWAFQWEKFKQISTYGPCCNQIQQNPPFIIYAMFNKMVDDIPSEPHTDQTVVSLLDRLRPLAPNSLSRALPVVKCGALSLVPRRSRRGQSWTLPWAVTSPRDTRPLFPRLRADNVCVFTAVTFMKWSQIFLRYLEKHLKIFNRKKNQEFPETYLGDFSWYLCLGLVSPIHTFLKRNPVGNWVI